MKSVWLFILFVSLLAIGCNDDSPSGPSTLPRILSAQLLPANEVPPVSNAEASGSGNVRIVLTLTKDSGGAITAASATFEVSLSGFPANTTLTGAHIHRAPAGVNAGVLVSTGLTSGEVVLTGGSGSFVKSGINVAADTAQLLLDNPAGFYFNVHSTLNAGGFARGQLALVQ